MSAPANYYKNYANDTELVEESTGAKFYAYPAVNYYGTEDNVKELFFIDGFKCFNYPDGSVAWLGLLDPNGDNYEMHKSSRIFKLRLDSDSGYEYVCNDAGLNRKIKPTTFPTNALEGGALVVDFNPSRFNLPSNIKLEYSFVDGATGGPTGTWTVAGEEDFNDLTANYSFGVTEYGLPTDEKWWRFTATNEEGSMVSEMAKFAAGGADFVIWQVDYVFNYSPPLGSDPATVSVAMSLTDITGTGTPYSGVLGNVPVTIEVSLSSGNYTLSGDILDGNNTASFITPVDAISTDGYATVNTIIDTIGGQQFQIINNPRNVYIYSGGGTGDEIFLYHGYSPSTLNDAKIQAIGASPVNLYQVGGSWYSSIEPLVPANSGYYYNRDSDSYVLV